MSNRDFLNKYHESEPYSFGGISQVQNYFNVKKRKVANILSKSDSYTTFKEFKKPGKTPPIRTHGPNYLWEADLMFFTHPQFSTSNDGFLYILAFIDTFTKAVGIMKLKTKDTKIVTQKMKYRFDNGDKPKYLRVDAGGEFLSHTFTQMCAKHDVKLYIAQEPIKCAFIERFNRTFKRILVQLMEHHNSIRWVDFVEQVLSIYHSRKHSSIGMSPDDAEDEENHAAIYEKMLRKFGKDNERKNMKNENEENKNYPELLSKTPVHHQKGPPPLEPLESYQSSSECHHPQDSLSKPLPLLLPFPVPRPPFYSF